MTERDLHGSGRVPTFFRFAAGMLCALSTLAAGADSRPLLAQESSAESVGVPANHGPAEPAEAPDLVLRSLRIPGVALRPRENDVSYTVNATGGCFYVTAGDASTVWNVPVLLPDGALVDTLRIYYYDTSASNMTAWFTVYDLYGVIVGEWSVSSNTSGGNSFNDTAQINHTVSYSAYSYAVNVRPLVVGSTMQFCGARIFYSY